MADQAGSQYEATPRANITEAERTHMLAEKIVRTKELVGRILTLIEQGAGYDRLKDMHELVGRLMFGIPAESLEGVPVAQMESKLLFLIKRGD